VGPVVRLALVLMFAAACARGGGSAPSGAPAAAPPAGPSQPAADAAGAMGAAAGGAESTTIQVPPTRVRAAHTVVSGNIAPLWLASDHGLWKQHGLDVELSLISGSPTAMAALMAGEIDFSTAAAEAALSVQAQNPEVVAVLNSSAAPTHRMVVTPDIQRIEELRGKRMGVFQVGDGNYVLLSKVLAKYGMNPERDVTWVGVGGGNFSGLVSALTAGAIDGTLFPPPNDLPAIKAGGHVLFNLADMDLPYAGLPMYTMRRTIDQRRPVVEAFLAGIVDGIRLYKSDPEQAKEALRLHAGMTDAETVDWTYEVYRGKPMAERPFVSVAGLQSVLDALVESEPALRQVQLDKAIDNSVLEELDRKGYLAKP
jgi:NitT/TauT family transport system substrate-binding protein